jgi:nucleoside-diphosphate-sugar epimerase
MRVVVVGGTGHVGTFLIPRLIHEGYEVVCIHRGKAKPYLSDPAWKKVQQVIMDREAEDAAGTFGSNVSKLKPDIVIDMICFDVAAARQLVEALRGKIRHFLSCGTIWVHGYPVTVPMMEDLPRRPFGEYGIKKAQLEAYLIEEAQLRGFPATSILPGHIVGPGWVPLDPLGTCSLDVYGKLARGQELLMPHQGLEMLHHVHADDVAQAFMKAIANRNASVGESFHAVSTAAMTIRGYAESLAAWFGQPARLRFVSWEEYRTTVSAEEAQETWDHLAHSSNCSLSKAQKLLDYRPRYSSMEGVCEALSGLIEHGQLRVKKVA